MVDSKLNIPVNLKGSQPQIQRIKKQDEEDHWISEEELYTEGSSDEEKPSHSSRKHNLKGMSQEDIEKREADLHEMRAMLKNLGEKLRNGKFVEEIYDVGKLRSEFKTESGKEVEDAERLAAQMSEVREFDRLLKAKLEEIKMAKLERMREAEETTEILKEISKTETTEAIKHNVDQFIRLLQNEVNEYPGENADEVITSRKAAAAAPRDRAKTEDAAKRPATFIERNIQLAKCGNGLLSLTDEEKVRLNAVLKDIERTRGKSGELNPSNTPAVNEYVLSDDVRRVLDDIDRKLEEHEKTKLILPSARHLELKSEGPQNEDSGKTQVKSRIDSKTRSEIKRLKEVDKLLHTLNSATPEAIDPLVDEELQILIEESRQLLSIETEASEPGVTDNDLLKKSKEAMEELVSAAKTSMPNFKFRYD